MLESWIAECGKSVDKGAAFGRVDHEIAVKPQMLESWIAECSKSVDKGAACVRLLL
jgi:hypothetical protein